MKRLAIVLAVIGASIFVGVILLVYWVLSYWPQGVQWDRVKSRTEQLFILGSVFIIAGGLISMYATKNVGQWRKMLLSLLSVALVLILGVSLVVPSQKSRHAESRYAFTTDWVSRNEEIWARQLEKFKGLPHIRALEIGSYEGRSTLWFLENILTHETASITCVDLFNGEFEKIFDKNIRLSGSQNKVEKIKGSSQQVLRTLEFDSYDLIYIDGSHIAKDVLTDAILAWDLLKTGGLIIFDDYKWKGYRGKNHAPPLRPQMAIDAYLSIFEPYIDVLEKDFQVVVRKKVKIELDSQDGIWNLFLRYMNSVVSYVFR